ncbi:MAG: hypothetical protein JZU64_12085, partial [Rhodoferax sp.]|nr:hypothetical protein [Rhodoferax sp.]
MCAICLERRTSPLSNSFHTWHAWSYAAHLCDKCHRNLAQQSDWRFFTVMHVAAAAHVIENAGFSMRPKFDPAENPSRDPSSIAWNQPLLDQGFSAAPGSGKKARTSTFPQYLCPQLNDHIVKLYDDLLAMYPDNLEPRSLSTGTATSRDGQAALVQVVPVQALMSISWATAISIAFDWAKHLCL